VDAALDAVVAVEERPVAEHLAAYENAHVLLRQALADTPSDATAEPGEMAGNPSGDAGGNLDQWRAGADTDAGQPAG
jgi:hypothetical protein